MHPDQNAKTTFLGGSIRGEGEKNKKENIESGDNHPGGNGNKGIRRKEKGWAETHTKRPGGKNEVERGTLSN